MTHHNHDNHDHNHDHEHGHNHHHHDHQSDMPFNEKMVKLLDHWIKHNAEHANTYRLWAKRAKENGFEKAGSLLDEAATATDQISKIFVSTDEIIKSKK